MVYMLPYIAYMDPMGYVSITTISLALLGGRLGLRLQFEVNRQVDSGQLCNLLSPGPMRGSTEHGRLRHWHVLCKQFSDDPYGTFNMMIYIYYNLDHVFFLPEFNSLNIYIIYICICTVSIIYIYISDIADAHVLSDG